MASPHLCGLEEWVQDSALPFTPPTTLPLSQVSLFPPLELRLCNYSHPQKKEGVNLRAQCEGQMGACSISQRFWVFVLGEQDLWGQSDKAQQHPPGYLQSEVQVYCLLPGGERPSVIDLFRSHHWEKNPGDNDYLRSTLSRNRPNSSPSCSSPSSWERGWVEKGPPAALGHSGEAPGDLIHLIPLLAGERGHSGFLRQAWCFFPMVLVWCSVLSIYISNLMAHKLLAEWFHYSPSVSYKREKRREQQEGRGGWGESVDTS